MPVEDPKGIVQRGYDAVSERYERTYDADGKYRSLIRELHQHLAPGSRVLDLGCGSGIPLARTLATTGHHVTGVDFSEVQIRRARNHVPAATFVQADATMLDLPAESFDAIVCLYALIHIPLADQPPLLTRIARWLRPGGLFVATTGHRALTGTEDDWLGGGLPMWWSQADAATNRDWIVQAGLTVDREEFVPEGDSGHALFWAHRSQPAVRSDGRPTATKAP